MKNLVGWFCVGFAVFFIAGGIVGWLNRVPPEAAIDLVAVRHTALTRKNGEDTLTYVCNSHDYFDFYLADGALLPDKNVLDHPLLPRPLSFENFETIFVAASGWELRGVVMEATEITVTNRDKIALLLGSVSGFYAGRWLFSTRLPGCASDEVLSRLQQVEYWDKLKRQKCRQICLRYRLWFSTTDNEPLVLNVDRVKKGAEVLPKSNTRDHIVGYLDTLQRIFRAASSSNEKLSENDFARVVGGIPFLLKELYDNPQVLRSAFPSRVPTLAFMLNDDPAVIKREIAEGTVTLNFGTNDSYQMLQGGIWSLEIIGGCLIVAFLLCAIVGTIFLARQRFSQTPKHLGNVKRFTSGK